MSGQNAFNKDRVVAACHAVVTEILKKRAVAKGDTADYLYGKQLAVVKDIQSSTVHCENATVNLSLEEFATIAHEYEKA